MSYPAYVIAPTKATWENGFPLPPQFLSLQADAQKVADGVKGTLQNGTDYMKAFGFSFVLDPTDPRQPWVILLNGSWSWAGLLIFDPVSKAGMYAPNSVNGGGIDNPGSFQQDPTTKIFSWVPVPPPAPPVIPAPPTPNDNGATWLAIQGGTTVTTQQFEQEVLYWGRTIGARLGIPPPAQS